MNNPEQAPQREATLSIRLLMDERQRLETSAAKADLSLSKYARQILVGDADELDELISTKGRKRRLPNMELTTALARANIQLDQVASELSEANTIGARVTLRFLVSQLEDIQAS
ncbi:MAG: hypothetical protein ABJ327_02950, partial [Litoreibacter sp.]